MREGEGFSVVVFASICFFPGSRLLLWAVETYRGVCFGVLKQRPRTHEEEEDDDDGRSWCKGI